MNGSDNFMKWYTIFIIIGIMMVIYYVYDQYKNPEDYSSGADFETYQGDQENCSGPYCW